MSSDKAKRYVLELTEDELAILRYVMKDTYETPRVPLGDVPIVPYAVLGSINDKLKYVAPLGPNPSGCGLPGKSVLIVRFDVTELSIAERDHLAGEVTVQGEASDDHPDAPVVDVWIEVTP